MTGMLVDYSCSSSEDENEANTSKNNVSTANVVRKLPNPFERSTPANNDDYDDSGEHQGRERAFPHERGNWVSYIYIQCPPSDGIHELQQRIAKLVGDTKLAGLELHPIDDLHMSLTKTVVLRHHWIDEFVRTAEHHLKSATKLFVPLNTIKVYCNDNRTRTFISLAFVDVASANQRHLCDLVARLDKTLAEFKLPAFYNDPSFHVSLLWCLGDRKNDLLPLLAEFCATLDHLIVADSTDFTIKADQLHCKIGNKRLSFHL